MDCSEISEFLEFLEFSKIEESLYINGLLESKQFTSFAVKPRITFPQELEDPQTEICEFGKERMRTSFAKIKLI